MLFVEIWLHLGCSWINLAAPGSATCEHLEYNDSLKEGICLGDRSYDIIRGTTNLVTLFWQVIGWVHFCLNHSCLNHTLITSRVKRPSMTQPWKHPRITTRHPQEAIKYTMGHCNET